MDTTSNKPLSGNRDERLSLAHLTPEEALKKALQTKPPAPQAKPRPESQGDEKVESSAEK